MRISTDASKDRRPRKLNPNAAAHGPSCRRRRGPAQRNRTSLIRTSPGQVHAPNVRPVSERIRRTRQQRIQPIQIWSDRCWHPGRQVASTLAGVSEIAFRHAMVFNNRTESLGTAYDNFLAETHARHLHHRR
jgi:hypothetical protein